MISYHKLGTITYHNLSNVMISHDKRVAVFPNSFSSPSHLPPLPPLPSPLFVFLKVVLLKKKEKRKTREKKERFTKKKKINTQKFRKVLKSLKKFEKV